MPLNIATNVASLNGIKNVNQTTAQLGRVFERISSGLRINQAADDAAGLGAAESLDNDERSLRQAARNANDGISLIQIAEGGSDEIANILKRMRELATQSASEALATEERSYVEHEFLQLSEEVDRIQATTVFPSQPDATQIDLQIGLTSSADSVITVDLGQLGSEDLGVTTGAMSLSTTTSAIAALGVLEIALTTVNTVRANYGAVQNRLESTLRNLESYNENMTAAESRIRDADFAFETAELAKFQILQQSGTAVLAQANSINQAALRLLQ
jgi:flagellin